MSAQIGAWHQSASTTGRAELLFWRGQKRAGAATGPDGRGLRGGPNVYP